MPKAKYTLLAALLLAAELSAQWAKQSVLREGTWHKVSVAQNGVYKLDYATMKGWGIAVSEIDPTTLKIYGNGGGMLPYDNAVERPDDLLELAVQEVSGGDGSFDAGDYFLFYAEGPHRWESTGSTFTRTIHRFSDVSSYFITWGGTVGRRIAESSTAAPASVIVNQFDDFAIHEAEERNLLKSGNRWYGEEFGVVDVYDFPFSFANIVDTATALVRLGIAARTIGATSSFSLLETNTNASQTYTLSSVSGSSESQYARNTTEVLNFFPSGSNLNFVLTFNKGTTAALGWLDYLSVHVRRQLTMEGTQLSFRDKQSVASAQVAQFEIGGVNSSLTVWDVTAIDTVERIPLTMNGNEATFKREVNRLREFVAFDGSGFLSVDYIGAVPNQNLHGLAQAELLVVTHPLFLTQAEELAQFHRDNDQMTAHVVTTEQVYNEYASGNKDITAIRDFTRMFYERAQTNGGTAPQHLLLVGDGSYDNKDVIAGNTAFIPTYQSDESEHHIFTYVSDDYYGLLDSNESDGLSDIVDIGIGRLVVKTAGEAQQMVDKVKHYYKQQTLGAWRNYIAFVGDDENASNLPVEYHMSQADQLATYVDTNYKAYNLDKIYVDAFPYETTGGGVRVPAVNEAIDLRVNDQGALLVSYVGHGGELGWAHERVLDVAQINKWTNLDNMPIFLTATCEFSRYDDPQRTSAGEFVVLNPSGGGIALLTTTRIVFASDNFALAQGFFQLAMAEAASRGLTRLGDLYRIAKEEGPTGSNSRKFSLLGDPAIRVPYPQHVVTTTSAPDTLRALSTATIQGEVRDTNGVLLEDFNGTVYPIIFDKPIQTQTLDNQGRGTTFSYSSETQVVFKGKASVNQGRFSFTFVVPKDISLQYGAGRISYYAENGVEDANGSYENMIIGGVSDSVVADETGPVIALYMNDNQFVSGGITDEDPVLLAEIFDQSGINTSGNAIGHDITAILDNDRTQPIRLNDFYTANTDDYQNGTVRYTFSDLDPGSHQISFKAWDAHNNSGEAFLSFVVSEQASFALDHVLNYPNPFTTKTAFYFEHNRPQEPLDIRIEVFTIGGKLVKTLDAWMSSDGFRMGPIEWDGRDEWGDPLGKGVYLYKLNVVASDGKSIDQYEKLVVLR